MPTDADRPTSAHLVVNTLALKRGGLVAAVRRRADALAESGTVGEVWIEVLGAQPGLENAVADLVRTGHLDPRVKVRSILSSLDESTTQAPPVALPQGTWLELDASTWDVVEDGHLLARVRGDVGGPYEWIDTFSAAGRRERRQELAPSGHLVREVHFPPNTSTATMHRWIGRDGRCYLTVLVDAKSKTWSRFWLTGSLELTSLDVGDAYVEAFTRALAPSQRPILFSEFRERLDNLPRTNLDGVVERVRHPDLRRVVVAHSNHLESPYTRGAKVSPMWARLIRQLRRWDLLVAWTHEQIDDLVEQFDLSLPTAVVSTLAPPVTTASGSVEPRRIVLVARVHRKKRVDEAVRILAEVRRLGHDATLEIFGFGYGDAEETAVVQLTDELGVRSSVVFREFTSSPTEIYGSAAVTLLTSQSEGFGQVLLESMAHGVPVVAYDSNYGPRTVVGSGENGFLVPFGDVATAARRVFEILSEPDLRERLSKGALATAREHSPERYASEWVAQCERVFAVPPRERVPSVTALTGTGSAVTLRLKHVANGTTLVARSGAGPSIRAVVRTGAVRVDLAPARGERVELRLRDESGPVLLGGHDLPERAGHVTVLKNVRGEVTLCFAPGTGTRLVGAAASVVRRARRWRPRRRAR